MNLPCQESMRSKIREELIRLYPQYSEKVEHEDMKKLDWELCGRGLFSESDLLDVYAKISEIPVMEEDELGDIEKFENISPEYLGGTCCLPYKWNQDEMEMLVCDPYSVDQIVYMFSSLYNKLPKFFLLKRSTLEHLINDIYVNHEQHAENDFSDAFLSEGGSEEQLRTLASEAKIVRLVNEMFSRASETEASDIHIEPERERVLVRFRIDGILQELMSAPRNQYPAIASRVKLIGGLNIAETRLPQDGRTNLQIGRSEMDVRISTIPTMDGESIVLRILRKDNMKFDLHYIGMNEDMRNDFEKLVSIPHGIILVVGPTGSGKTTTLYSIMSKLNTPGKKIITIEDPVEYKIERLSQIHVNQKIGLTFASGLRHIVRQDPDIILVGEIRDKETADIAINAALTGHLVLSTLHTNDAPGAVSRLLDMGVEGFLLSSALYGVLSQRLLRKICTKCKGSGHDFNMTGNKCKNCSGSGFRGRTGIFELLIVNDEIRSAISKNLDSTAIAELAGKNGMKPIIEDARAKVAANITTESELIRATSST